MSRAALPASESGPALPLLHVASAQLQVARGTGSCRREIRTEKPKSVVRNFRGVLRESGKSRITWTTAADLRGHDFAAAACKQ
mmetsp:Transcript_96413/g.299787  ORF Transcript_96413/g.299787 Transcript_96413/m.299787 type:complete len:83 (-) Transcript_96413:414-662(-)